MNSNPKLYKMLKNDLLDCLKKMKKVKQKQVIFKEALLLMLMLSIFNKAYRECKSISYFIYPRKNHRFKLGKEILIDMYNAL